MPWNDRIIEARYTAPSGEFIIFNYENVRKAFDKKTTAFNFPDADGTFIQDMGHSGRRYPLRVFFWGDDYDLEAAFFEKLLQERGTGKLEHPVYGTVDVVPFGTITQRDDLKTAANQAVVDVVFWETIGIVYPASQIDPASNVLTSVDEYNDAAATEFEDVTSLDSAVEQSSFSAGFTSLLDSTQNGLQAIADVQADVQAEFNAINDSINNSLDILISQPLNLAFQTVLLIQSPALALANISARLNAYNDLADAILSGEGASVSTTGDARQSNDFHAKNLFASTYVTGSILSVVNNTFNTKTDALEAAEAILVQLDDLIEWRDTEFTTLSEIDTGGAYQQLQEAVALTAGFLVEISFTLKQERRLILNRSRTIIDLVAELYGSIDDQLDFFITSNDLSGSEILELPKGREIVYYI